MLFDYIYDGQCTLPGSDFPDFDPAINAESKTRQADEEDDGFVDGGAEQFCVEWLELRRDIRGYWWPRGEGLVDDAGEEAAAVTVQYSCKEQYSIVQVYRNGYHSPASSLYPLLVQREPGCKPRNLK